MTKKTKNSEQEEILARRNKLNVFEREKFDNSRFSIDYAVNRSASWFNRKIADLKTVSATQIMKDTESYRTKFRFGELYCFYYHAKHRDTLPYWDMFPIILPLNVYADGFLGMNFHYIRPKDRITLFHEIQKHGTGPRHITVTYDIIKSFSQSKHAQPTIKRYLFENVATPFRTIRMEDAGLALLVPCERFVKAKKEKVWRDSTKRIR